MNCIRADTPGKQEAEPAVLKRARVVVDSWEQASHSGQVNVPVTNGLIDKSNLKVELGEWGFRVTLFDFTRLAIQDSVTAKLVYRKALAKKTGH